MRRFTFLLCVLLVTGCAKAPPSLSPDAARTFQANQAVVAIGTLQHAALGLNKIQVCQPAPCRPLLSDRNTGVVVDTVATTLTALRGVPQGWKATAQSSLTTMAARLDASGKTQLAAYLTAASTIIDALIP